MPMGVVMVTTILVDAFRRALASWRGQLVVLAVGTLLLGLTFGVATGAGDLLLRMVVGWVEVVVLLGASVRMAVLAEAGYEFEPENGAFDLAAEVLGDAPRLLAQVGVLTLVPLAACWAALQLISMAAMLGFVLVPLMFVVLLLSGGPALLAVSAVVLGDRDWLPRAAVRAARPRLGLVTRSAIAGGVVASLAAVPLALFGFVAMSVLGMFGFAGTGLVAAGSIPWIGCGALALWRAVGATIGTSEGQGDDHAAAALGARDADATAAVAAAFGAAPATSWLPGPTWDVAIDAGAVWGTWIRIEAASVMGFRVSWNGGPAPDLTFASEAGSWTDPGTLGASGSVLQAAMPAGSTYVQLSSQASAAQAVTLELLVPAAAAA